MNSDALGNVTTNTTKQWPNRTTLYEFQWWDYICAQTCISTANTYVICIMMHLLVSLKVVHRYTRH